MLPDYSTAEIVVAFGGTVTAGGILTMLLQAVKDFFPAIRGRWSMGAIYFVSFLSAIFLLIGSDPAYDSLLTYGGFFVIWGSLVVVARGIYHQMFQGPAAQEAIEERVEEKLQEAK